MLACLDFSTLRAMESHSLSSFRTEINRFLGNRPSSNMRIVKENGVEMEDQLILLKGG